MPILLPHVYPILEHTHGTAVVQEEADADADADILRADADAILHEPIDNFRTVR